MFEKENPFISRMTDNMNVAIEGRYSPTPCAPEIKSMIEDFFIQSMESINLNESNVCWHIVKITEIVRHLAGNTRNYSKLSTEDITFLKKIFYELEVLRSEVLTCSLLQSSNSDLSLKIICINEIICKNMVGMRDSKEKHNNYRDGMIFQNYEDLWKIIHRVNTEWNELCKKGFSLTLFYNYWISFKHDRATGVEKSESEKLMSFMAVLDGKNISEN